MPTTARTIPAPISVPISPMRIVSQRGHRVRARHGEPRERAGEEGGDDHRDDAAEHAVRVARHDQRVSATAPTAPFVHAVRIRPRRLDESERDYTDELPAFARRRADRARPARDVPRRRERQRQVDARRGDRRRVEAQSGGRRPHLPVQLRDARVALAAPPPPRARAGGDRAAQRVLPPRRERLQPRDGVESGSAMAGRLPAAAARAVARRVVPRHRGQPARPARPLLLRRARGRAVGERPARADAPHARARARSTRSSSSRRTRRS